MNKYLDKFLTNKAVVIFYKGLMPGVTIIFLIVVSQVISRPYLFDSWFADLFIRVILCIWFCIGYTRVLNVSQKYRLYPNITPSKSGMSPGGKIFSIGMAIFFGTIVSILTTLVLNYFLPFLSNFCIVVSVINGLLFSIPLLAHYEVFKV